MASFPPQFVPGTIVGGRYRIEALLGQGGFGAVFLATQLNLDRPVALKALLPEALDAEGLGRFQREAAIVQRLSHPNVVRLLDFGVAASAEPFLVFELLEGQTLEQAIRAGGPMPVARVARVATQILKALMEAHSLGIVHRDIKPANVFLCNFQGEPDFVKLLDFGIAKGREAGTLTQRGGVIGTPAYMAPEQVNGGDASFATDLYALGLTMEEALTGRPVFAGASLVDIIREHVSPNPVPHAPAAMASPLGPILHRATQKAAERRHPSAAEMLVHVEAAMSFARTGAFPAPQTPGHAGGYLQGVPSMAYSPTSPRSAPVSYVDGGYPFVPPAPARTGKKRGGRTPWAVFAAIGGGAVVLGGALAVVLSLDGRGGESRPAPRASGSAAAPPGAGSARAAASAAPEPFNITVVNTPVEAQVNGDGVLDIISFCSTKYFGAPSDICVTDGATFRPLWRRPAGFDASGGSGFLGATGRTIVTVDPGAVAHVLDAGSGAEQGAIRLGAHAELMCVPSELPGKVWIKTAQRGLMIDTATRTAAEANRPASCVKGPLEFCEGDTKPNICPVGFAEIKSPDFFEDMSRIEGRRGVLVGYKKTDRSFPVLAGFEPLFGNAAARYDHTSKILWQRPLAPGDGLGAVGLSITGNLAFVGGRAVVAYEHASGTTRLMAADPVTGNTLWEVTMRRLHHFTLTPTRVYVYSFVGNRIDVRDAATGHLLGGFGPKED
jgi:Protein kinase domain